MSNTQYMPWPTYGKCLAAAAAGTMAAGTEVWL